MKECKDCLSLASELAVTTLNLMRAESSLERETSWRIRYYRDLVRARDELAAAKAELTELQHLFQRTHNVHHSWVAEADASRSRAESAESRLGEIEQALEKVATGHLNIMNAGVQALNIAGRESGYEHHDRSGPSVASALIAAWKQGTP